MLQRTRTNFTIYGKFIHHSYIASNEAWENLPLCCYSYIAPLELCMCWQWTCHRVAIYQ